MNPDKMREFVLQLLNSGSLKGLNISDKEESVITILNTKEEKLKLTFTSPDYYPDMTWENIKLEIMRLLGEEIAKLLMARIKSILFNSIKKLTGFPEPDTSYRGKIHELIGKLISRHQSRKYLWKAD